MKEEATPNLKKIKFGRRVTEDAKSVRNSNKETNSRTILISKIHISLNCSTTSVTLPIFVKLKEMEKSLVEVKEKQLTIDEGRIYKGIIIKPSKGSKPQKVIVKKPTVEMKKNTLNVKSTRGAT